jgi:hypothetical protein
VERCPRNVLRFAPIGSGVNGRGRRSR